MKWKDSFHPYALITVIFWSLSYVLTRLALEYFSPFSIGFLRYFFASLALVIVAVSTKMKLPHKSDLVWFIAAGALGFFLYMITFNMGLTTVTASTSSVVIATVPVMTALFALFFYKETLRSFQWIAILIEFIGVVVLTLMNGAFSINIGLFWLFGAALSLSLYNLVQRKLTKAYTALQASTFSIFFGTLMLTLFLPGTLREMPSAPVMPYIHIAIMGICSSAAAYVAWAKAFSKAKQTSQVSNYMFLTPFLTTLLGFLMAGEVPDRATVLGGGIILLGVLVFNFGGKLCRSGSHNEQ
ncbi:MAG TPA: EamA family transporter [Clostridiales bacterium]|nr:EamA family transporter [Clostridiales bacterium]